MKYIRTKDGRILLGTFNDNDLTGMVLDYQNGKVVKIPIIAQSDTIEELCDLILCWQGKQWGFFVPIELKWINKEKWDKIYGAIWTSKGLIYVAKMNDKGELELL